MNSVHKRARCITKKCRKGKQTRIKIIRGSVSLITMTIFTFSHDAQFYLDHSSLFCSLFLSFALFWHSLVCLEIEEDRKLSQMALIQEAQPNLAISSHLNYYVVFGERVWFTYFFFIGWKFFLSSIFFYSVFLPLKIICIRPIRHRHTLTHTLLLINTKAKTNAVVFLRHLSCCLFWPLSSLIWPGLTCAPWIVWFHPMCAIHQQRYELRAYVQLMPFAHII